MVKYVTFNHQYEGSNPSGLIINGYKLMVD
jgi:hypothetical protein